MNITATSNDMGKGKRPFKAIVTLVTLVAFLFNAVSYDLVLLRPLGFVGQAWAAETDSSPDRVGSPNIALDLTNMSVPLRFGEIKETFKGTNGKTIIHIQDAHCNYAAQTSIEGIIKHLTANYNNVDLLSLEGGKGNYDLSILTNIQDPIIREKVSDYFVKEGRVSGPEFFAINNPGKVKLFGIEDENLYKENLNVYRSSLASKEEADKHLNTLSTAITNLKLKIYSPELKEFDTKTEGYKANKTDFKDYIVFLNDKAGAAGIDLKTYKNIASLMSILNEEKLINFKEADRERNKLIDKINAKVSKRDLEELVIKSTQFKMGDMTSEEFYSYLFKKAQFSGVDFATLPNLVKYSEYVKRYETLDKSAIFNEVKALEEALINKAAKTEDQKTLYSLSKDLAIIRDMMNISLVKDEFDYYLANKDNFNVKRFIDFINTKAPLYGFNFKLNNGIEKLDSYRENMEKFYIYSLKRDDAFIKNIEKKLKDEKKDITILVTGGFHTGNLSKLFKDNGYTYIEVMPKFGKTDIENPYFRLLSGGKSPIEAAVETLVFNIATASMFSEMDIGMRYKYLFGLSESIIQALIQNPVDGVTLKMSDGRTIKLTTKFPEIGEKSNKFCFIRTEDTKVQQVYSVPLDNPLISDLTTVIEIRYDGYEVILDNMSDPLATNIAEQLHIKWQNDYKLAAARGLVPAKKLVEPMDGSKVSIDLASTPWDKLPPLWRWGGYVAGLGAATALTKALAKKNVTIDALKSVIDKALKTGGKISEEFPRGSIVGEAVLEAITQIYNSWQQREPTRQKLDFLQLEAYKQRMMLGIFKIAIDQWISEEQKNIGAPSELITPPGLLKTFVKEEMKTAGEIVKNSVSHNIFGGDPAKGYVVALVPKDENGVIEKSSLNITGVKSAIDSLARKIPAGNVELDFRVVEEDGKELKSIILDALNNELSQTRKRFVITKSALDLAEDQFREDKEFHKVVELYGATVEKALNKWTMLLLVNVDQETTAGEKVRILPSYGMLGLEILARLNLSEFLEKEEMATIDEFAYSRAYSAWVDVISRLDPSVAKDLEDFKNGPDFLKKTFDFLKKTFEIALPKITKFNGQDIINSFRSEIEVLRAL